MLIVKCLLGKLLENYCRQVLVLMYISMIFTTRSFQKLTNAMEILARITGSVWTGLTVIRVNVPPDSPESTAKRVRGNRLVLHCSNSILMGNLHYVALIGNHGIVRILHCRWRYGSLVT